MYSMDMHQSDTVAQKKRRIGAPPSFSTNRRPHLLDRQRQFQLLQHPDRRDAKTQCIRFTNYMSDKIKKKTKSTNHEEINKIGNRKHEIRKTVLVV